LGQRKKLSDLDIRNVNGNETFAGLLQGDREGKRNKERRKGKEGRREGESLYERREGRSEDGRVRTREGENEGGRKGHQQFTYFKS
jgi:hypothetical protein